VPAGILLLLVVTPRLYAAPYRFLVQDNPFAYPPPSVRYLQHHLPPHRRVTADFCRYRGGRLSGYTLLSPNQGVVWGLRDARLCNPSWLSTYRDLSRWWTAIDNGFTTSSFCLAGGRFLSWLGVSYVAVPHGDEAGKGMTLVFRGDPADIWKVAGHPSRARMVYSWVRCDDPYQAARLSREGLTRPQTTFRLPVGGLAGSGAPPKRVPIWNIQWLEDGMDTVRLEVRTSQAGLLFLADSDAPGWGASLDGHRTRIYRAMGAFRAVRIPAGRHLVLMKYRGNGFRTGALLTLLAILALVAALAGPPVRRAMLTRRRE
ncbi:MAG: YfhO family protein, partial [Acidobacteriota bacterium]